jgi:lysophospholipase L1-like esterase
MRWTLSLMLALLLGMVLDQDAATAADRPLEGVRRVVFLGDSITYAGHFIDQIEAYLRLNDPALRVEFIDIGLPSETVSGLTEPGHAGGKFPRPELRERLDRVLEKAKPDLVVACYGMNDGIYHPFSEERFAAYRDGMAYLRDHAKAAGAKVLHLTPPVFDPLPIKANTLPAGLAEYPKPFEGYDEVLTRYSDWLLARRADGWDVIDVHGPMKAFLEAKHAQEPSFRLAGDGVHINPIGHWIIAREVLRHWGVEAPDLGPAAAFQAKPGGMELLGLVESKQAILKAAWLTETGHKRPGMGSGLPMDEANRKAGAIEGEIQKQLGGKP